MEQDKIEIFIKRKKDECLKLIQYRIWDGIDSNQLKAWLRNFTSLEEKFFAACVLDWLVYRSDEHVVSMLYDLLTRHLHNEWRMDGNPLYNVEKNPLDLLCEKYGEIGFRYVTAVTKSDPDTKSGYHIASVLNHSMGISSTWNIKAEKIENVYNEGIRTFLFLDDISGTGEQMSTVLKESNVFLYKDVHVYALLCAAHEKAVIKIKEDFPEVHVLCAEYIPEDSCFFEHIPIEQFDLKTVDDIREWYVNFMKGKGLKPKSNCLGRGDLGLVYAFQNNVPNDSLPILFHENEKNSFMYLLKKRGR